ncbi:MAG: DNA repair protein RecO (recombination protein O) [Candidatus Binatia bacterium]|jgi:DNA repair protein RecO (recombination protein O)
MDERATGIILRTRPLTESSLIVHWLTPDLGRIATVAKGARRAKSPFRGKLDLFYSAAFSLGRSRRSELHNLREVSLNDTRPELRRELDWLRQAAYGARFIEQVTETETPLPGIYELLSVFLARLTATEASPVPVFAFELWLLREIGQQPNLDESTLSDGGRQIVERLLAIDWATPGKRKLTEEEFAELRGFLRGFIAHNLERVPKGRDEALLHKGA